MYVYFFDFIIFFFIIISSITVFTIFAIFVFVDICYGALWWMNKDFAN